MAFTYLLEIKEALLKDMEGRGRGGREDRGAEGGGEGSLEEMKMLALYVTFLFVCA